MSERPASSNSNLETQESFEKVTRAEIAITQHAVPQLEDYNIREVDDEVTSSDERSEEHHDSSFRSWFSRSRHHKPAAASVSPAKLEPFSSSDCAIAEGTPNRCDSSSSFRKGFRSFFRKESTNEAEELHVENSNVFPETPGNDVGEETKNQVEEKGAQEESEALPETPTNNKFWRSWRSGHHHHHRHHRHSKEVFESQNSNEEAGVETLRNPSLDVGSMISHEEKRQKNMIKLADQLEDVSTNPSPEREVDCSEDFSTPEKRNSDVESSQSDSTSSSVERALNVKERVGLVFSASPEENGDRDHDEISPLTPPGEVLDNPYKYVFDQKDEVIAPIAHDPTYLHKDSTTFKNLDDGLKLLTRNVKALTCGEIHSDVALSEISTELLDFIRHEMECRERSIKEKELMSNDLICLKKQIATWKIDCEGKESQISEVQKALDTANGEIEKYNHDLEEAAQEIDMLTQEVESYKGKVQEAKSHERKAIENLEESILHLKEKEESESKSLLEISKENVVLKERMEKMQREHKNLIFDHELLQEKHSITTTRLADLVGSFSKGQGQERDMRDNLEATSSKLRRYENTIEVLKIGNLKIQDNFHRERRKLLDSRQEKNYLKRQMQFIDFHRTQSLQFMSHLMFYYRSIVTDETLAEYDHYLKKLNESDFSSGSVHLKDDELKAYFKEREALVVKFYNDIARRSFLDQVVSKHVSYMRSNKFLSSQLAGLRKHLEEYEQYVSRLLKEILTHKNLEEKNKQKIASLQEKNTEYKSKLSQIAN